MKLNKQLLSIPKRFFGPKAAPAKGGPAAAAPPPPPVDMAKTPFQQLIEAGQEFPLGPPPGVHIVQGAHRDTVVPKLAPRIEVFAKKLRDYYIREGVLPEAKTYLNTVRDRQPEDTIQKLHAQKLVAGN